MVLAEPNSDLAIMVELILPNYPWIFLDGGTVQVLMGEGAAPWRMVHPPMLGSPERGWQIGIPADLNSVCVKWLGKTNITNRVERWTRGYIQCWAMPGLFMQPVLVDSQRFFVLEIFLTIWAMLTRSIHMNLYVDLQITFVNDFFLTIWAMLTIWFIISP